MPLVDLPGDAQLDAAPATPGSQLVDLPANAQLDAPPDRGFWGGATDAAGSLAQNLSAAMQGTNPIVRTISGTPNYQALGPYVNSDGGPMYSDAQGQWHPVDPTRQVVLNDPATNKPTVFLRSGDTDESGLTSLGRFLGFGAAAPSSVATPGLVAPATRALGNAFGGDDTRALAQIGRAMKSDVAAGGPGPAEIGQGLANGAGTPVNAIDVAGENVRGLVGQVARMPGPGRQEIMSTLNGRDAGSGPRLAQAVNDVAGVSPGNFLVARALNDQAKTAAAPLYGKAYLAPPLNPDTIVEGGALDKFMSRPAIQNAATNALSIAKEEGRDPASLGITFNDAGDPAFEKVPSWQTLDYVKRGLDDVLNGYRDSTTGRLNLDERGNAINQTRRAFVNFLDTQNPDYAAARAAYSGPQQSRSALLQGASAFNRDPDQITSDIQQLSPGDQSFYRVGAANALKTTLAKTSSGGDEARQIIGNNYRQAQLRAIFPNADQLLGAAKNESTMFGTRQAVLGGSQTASRLAQDGSGEGGGMLRPIAEAVTAGITHEPILAAKSGLSALQNIFKIGGKVTPEVGSKIAGYLLQSDPQASRAWLMDAFGRVSPPRSQLTPALPLAGAAVQQPQALLSPQ
jgi:hypothetical protein